MKGKATYAYWLDKKRIKQDNRFPVKLRVTYQRKRKYYSTGVDLSQDEWDNMHSVDKVTKSLRKTLMELLNFVDDAKETGDKLSVFSFHQFEDAFFNAPDDSMDVYESYERKIEALRKEGREGTRSNYVDSMNSLKAYKSQLSFHDVNADFLNKYEKHMLARGRNMTTIGFYLRPLRAVFNQAIRDKVISVDHYPFTKDQYKIPTGKKGKVTLTQKEVGLIHNYQALPLSTEDRSKDFWLFSFFCNGMNFKDIFNLKYSQIDESSFSFIREKTKLTKKEAPIIVSVQLNEYTIRIIEKWGNKSRNPDNFVFPFINTELTEERRKKALKQFIKTTNKYLKRICTKVGIEKKVTTYVARHTFAFRVIDSGYSIEVLRELLGHTDIKTTQSYINDIIPSKTKVEIANCLAVFDDKPIKKKKMKTDKKMVNKDGNN